MREIPNPLGIVKLWIEGQPPRKSNSRQIMTNHKKGRPMVVKSKGAREWVDSALKQITGDKKLSLGSPTVSLRVTCYVFYKTKRPDLSIELVLDTLQKAEVISDDRHVYIHHAYKLFSKKVQGVYVIVEEVDNTLPMPSFSSFKMEAQLGGDPKSREIFERAYGE